MGTRERCSQAFSFERGEVSRRDTAWRDWWPLLAVPAAGAGYDCLPERRWQFVPLWEIPTYLLLRAAAGGVCRARSGGGAHSLERRQAAGDLRHDGIAGPLGPTVELAETAQVFQISGDPLYRSVE